VRHEAISILPLTRVIGTEPRFDALRVRLDTGDAIDVDHVLYATGYKVDMSRVPLVKSGNLLARIACREGFPVLDDSLQTTVPGLFVTSMPATRDFGLFFGFTVAVRASARVLGRAIERASGTT
jgi:hypothetical protein